VIKAMRVYANDAIAYTLLENVNIIVQAAES
jgi:hypothetical protein